MADPPAMRSSFDSSDLYPGVCLRIAVIYPQPFQDGDLLSDGQWVLFVVSRHHELER